jgi:hypothetical protein
MLTRDPNKMFFFSYFFSAGYIGRAGETVQDALSLASPENYRWKLIMLFFRPVIGPIGYSLAIDHKTQR